MFRNIMLKYPNGLKIKATEKDANDLKIAHEIHNKIYPWTEIPKYTPSDSVEIINEEK